MPLLDHFHGDTQDDLPWPTMTMAWAVAIMGWLNRTLPRGGYIALTDIRTWLQAEADVAEYRQDDTEAAIHGRNGAVATLVEAPSALVTFAATFPEEAVIEIRERRGGRTLVGVIELVSPANKDRATERESFVAKCVAYLRRGIGVVIVDIVTTRHANLHNELMQAIGGPEPQLMPTTPTYISGYRPVHRRATHANEIEAWPYPATVGQLIPAVPLGLRGGPIVLIDLEATYMTAIESTGL